MGTFVLTPDEMREIDRWTIREFGIPEFTLMEMAGRGIASIVEEKCEGERVLVFAGSGNNGGDGFVAARYLLNKGYDVAVVLVKDRNKIRGIAQKNLKLFEKIGGEVFSLDELDYDAIWDADIVIDAIFGTGLKGKIDEKIAGLIDVINTAHVDETSVVSVDIPSGVNGLTGEVGEHAVFADYTGTMAYPKRGLFLYPGRLLVGKLRVIDIGIPTNMPKEPYFELLEKNDVFLPVKLGNEHKGKNGKLLVISGAKNYTGAPIFVSDAAMRTGAGLIILATRDEVYQEVSTRAKEPVVIPYKTPEDIEKLIKTYEPDGIVFGPGVGRSEDTIKILKIVLSTSEIPLLIDADGVWALSKLDSIKKRKNVVITPHPGEASYLLDAKAEDIDRGRFDYAIKLHKLTGYNVVLKGNPTIISTDERGYVNINGNEGLGKGGSGDVLSGLIGGFMVQSTKLENAVCLGVHLHALVGDILYEKMHGPFYTPSDIIDNLHEGIKALIV